MSIVKALTGGRRAGSGKADVYPTPAYAVQALLEVEKFDGSVWEPACGDGAISRFFPGCESTDLYDTGYGESGIDFLKTFKPIDNIVTNPPYSCAQKFVEHAITCASKKVAMLLKLNFLEGQRRHKLWLTHPPKTVYVFSKRIAFFDVVRGLGGSGGLLAYAWYVWDKEYAGKTTIDWLKP